MAKMKYSRIKFTVRRKEVICIGQKQTRRGVNYNAETVRVPLEGKSAAELKSAVAIGTAALLENS